MQESLRGSRVLVTGASGFVGRALAACLAERGAEVHGVSRSARPSAGPVSRWWKADLADGVAVARLLSDCRPTRVFHLAGAVTGSRDPEAVASTFAGNLASAVHLLSACLHTGCGRLVLAGSLEEPPPPEPDPLPASPYAASKWAAAGYARMFHALYGLPVSVARIFMVYGPGQDDLGKLVPYVCLSALRGEAPELMSGSRPVDWIYVDDVAEGLAALAESGVVDGRHVDLGSGELVTTGEIAERICRLSGSGVRPRLGALPDRPMEQVRRADPALSAELTGWRPTVTLDDGLARTLEWYRELARSERPAGGRR